MFKSIFTLFAGSFIGKIIGFIREVIISTLYGTTAPVGAFRMAQSASLIPVNFFTSDSLNSGFIPLYNRYSKSNKRKAQSLFWLLLIFLGAISILISVSLYFGASWVTTAIAPGFSEYENTLAQQFIQIIALGIPFYVIGALFSYLAMANSSYYLASIRPSIQSMGMITGVILAYYSGNISFFAWGFSGAYMLFFILGLKLLRDKRLLGFYLDEIGNIVAEFWHTIKPLLLLPFMLQGNILIERIVSSYMGIEVVASLEYAKFITETGIVLLAMPLGLVGLSTLSGISKEKVKDKLLQIIPTVLVITVPISLFLAIYSSELITILFKRGAFTSNSVALTKSILVGLAIGFWAQVAAYVMIKALNAQNRNKEVAICMAIALSCNAIFNILLFKSLGAITIGIGASLYGIVLFLLTIYAFGFIKDILKVIVPLFLLSCIYYFLSQFFVVDSWLDILFSVLVFILFWSISLFIVPSLREITIFLVKRISRRYE